MFEKLLIANRGEIACRIARTAKRMGLVSVGVYSEADADALHVDLCDEVFPIGPAPAQDSYLRGEKILEVAKRSNAQAIHPGYGFLSENAEFAQACKDAGLIFIGPPPSAIAAMGVKSEAKALIEKAGVPTIPGYHEADQSESRLQAESRRIGYPQILKASAGGGGKGLRVIADESAFEAALASARREAMAAFGDDRMLIERYLDAPRHIEVQVFADGHGNLVHLFERDCSAQRRHQKLLEEAPAPGLTEDLRHHLGQAAIDVARAVSYQGAGTVEFLLDQKGAFYFMEMNTRLQVEHPITEMISGLDLVQWQICIAAGQPLPLRQQDLRRDGHAVEARIYAETPENDFLPASGKIRYLGLPETGTQVRVDTGVRQNDVITTHYDPLIAKLIVWDSDRSGALRRMRRALADFRIVGLKTNLEFLATLCAHPTVEEGGVTTDFIETRQRELLGEPADPPDDVLALAALHEVLSVRQDSLAAQAATKDPTSPWGRADGWRLNQTSFHQLDWRAGSKAYRVRAHYAEKGFVLDLPGGSLQAQGVIDGEGNLLAELDGRRLKARLVSHGIDRTLLHRGRAWHFTLDDPLQASPEGDGEKGGLSAPLPGTVIDLAVAAGDSVRRGTVLAIVEAMKMEHSITAPGPGVIGEVFFAVGDRVEEGDVLLTLNREDDP